jgi:hypothetical protein
LDTSILLFYAYESNGFEATIPKHHHERAIQVVTFDGLPTF